MSKRRGMSSYRNDSAQALEHVSLGPAVEKLLKLARRQYPGRCLAGIAGVACGFEGEVAGCREGPVSEGGRMHGRGMVGGNAESRDGGGRAAEATRRGACAICACTGGGGLPVSSMLDMREMDSMARHWRTDSSKTGATTQRGAGTGVVGALEVRGVDCAAGRWLHALAVRCGWSCSECSRLRVVGRSVTLDA